ncbi:MAG: thymidine phosphorylase [Acidobacteria bacterium RIFCSPLOWO2_02_FULL_67_36]|nr:MAG: thymidine phosphorylase [Acidobacteria bacterium RIFCSPLOWO2_02_FULL_67_36]OFW21350.1 MAG: thymidine phosphorylase [Acidobacteria bacterium RIFCSPLOWO2_12_FULL_66_21]
MRAVDLIRRKRDGGTLDRAEIDFFIAGITDLSLPDYQAAALLMAIFLRGMTMEETAWLTEAMVASGVRMAYTGLDRTPVDKHSTGGVGDKTSLILAPLATACGARVPMMSGRGLGHTGGTLDKLEAIPGFRTALSLAELRAALTDVGCALVGQTSEIAPADRRLYALRDVTGTVESIPLICASIMSKKIAEGIGALVLDVKTGAGAFMKTVDDSRRLARSLVAIGEAAGVRTEAVITSMDSPLGRMVGNSLEVIESIETLKGNGPADVEELAVLLAARMLVASGVETGEPAAEVRVRAALASGAGLDVFRRVIERQGGDPRVADDYGRLPSAPDRRAVCAPRAGYVAALEAEGVGRAAVALGAGRARLDDRIDPGVGVEVLLPPGAQAAANEPVLMVHHRGGHGLADALPLLERAIVISDRPPSTRPLVIERILHG